MKTMNKNISCTVNVSIIIFPLTAGELEDFGVVSGSYSTQAKVFYFNKFINAIPGSFAPDP
jgi:hypothetical protein